MGTKNAGQLLAQLNIDRDSFRVVGLMPLVYVGWADGKLQRTERSRIRQIAAEKGWLAGNGQAILDRWLSQPPSDEEVRAGLELIASLAHEERGLGTSVPESTLQDLLYLCREVAVAAGGHLGYPMAQSAISEVESTALAHVAEVFAIDSGRTWKQLVREVDARPEHEPPSPPGNLLLGHTTMFLKDPVGFTMRAAELGDVVKLRFPGETMYLLRRPEHLKHVLVDNARNYVRGKDFERLAGLVGPSMITTEGDVWRKLRRTSQPSFHKDVLGPMASTISGLCGEMLDEWKTRGKPIDAAAEMMRLTLRVIGRLSFSTDIGDGSSEIGSAVAVILKHANDLITNPFHIPDYIPTPENLRVKHAIDVFDRLIFQQLAERRREKTHTHDLLGLLLEAKDEETGEGLSDEEIRNELRTFLVAGHETTSVALTWTLVLLSKHPAVLQRLCKEVDDALGGKVPTLANLPSLRYATMVCEESMRLYPPIWMTSRAAVAEDEIAGYRVPRGMALLLSPYVTHRLADVWENPEGFDPERFAPDKVAARHPSAYFPFFAGPHKCIGYPLAMMEMQIILPMIVQRYRLNLVAGCDPEPEPATTLRPKGEVWMTVHAASSSP
jgi:cytochrome P450